MEYRRIFKDGSNLLIGRVGTAVIGLINLMILTRILTTEEMGKYSLFLMVVNLALTLGLNWSDASIVRHGREEFVKHRKINQSFWARFYLFFPLLSFFILIFIIFRNQIAEYIGIEPILIFFVIGMFLFNGILNSIMYLYQSIDKMKKAAYVLFSQKLVYLFGLSLIFFKFVGANLTLVLILVNLSFLVSLIFNLLRFDFNLIKPFGFDKKYFDKIWSFSWPQLLGFSGIYVINYIDLYVIQKYLTISDVGIYNVAYTGFALITSVLLLLNIVFMPLIVEYKTTKKYDLIRKYLTRIPLLYFAWTFFSVLGILSSKFIITFLFSTKYINAIPSFNILLIVSILVIIDISFIPLINSFDLVLHFQIFKIIVAAVNIIADFILVPQLGIIGAAYGTMVAYTIGLILSIQLVFNNRKKIFWGQNEKRKS